MNTLPLILAEVTNWPAALAAIVPAACIAFIVCVVVTGRWPWERK